MNDQEYFALRAISNSRLRYLAESPFKYWASWKREFQETDAMRFGTMFHCYLLEPEEFENRYFVLDLSQRPDTSKTMAARVNKDWKEMILYQEAESGRKMCTYEDIEKCKAMKRSVYREIAAWSLIDEPGLIEHAHTWDEPVEYYSLHEEGMKTELIPMKMKADKWLKDSGIILDLKTTRDAGPKWWAKHAWDFGYHRQAALYSDNLPGVNEYYILAVETSWPHEVALYKADNSLLDKGRDYDPGTSDPGYGYKPLLKRLCQLREIHGTEFGDEPWPMYGYWTKEMGIYKWGAPSWI